MRRVTAADNATATPEKTAEHVLDEAHKALAERSYYSRYPESPSPRVYGENAAAEGLSAYESLLGKKFEGLAGAFDGEWVGEEKSPYGPTLDVAYPHLDVKGAMDAAGAAMPSWRNAGPRRRAVVLVEALEQLNKRSFEIANAVQHTSGQPFVMAFQAGGPQAQDRGLEAVAAAYVEQARVPASVTWEKPGRGEPTRMQKDYHVVARGVGLVIGCNTFPTWNAYPGIFASLATGNPVVIKPHPSAVLPLAITVEVLQKVLRDNGFHPELVQLAPEAQGEGLAKVLAERPEVKIIDYTGGPSFGAWLEREGAARGQQVYTEKAGVNTVVVDSTDNVKAMLGNLAFSLSLYTGQMCTTPQNIYLPKAGIDTDEGHLSFEEFGTKLAGAIGGLTGDDAKAVEVLGATVNDDVRARAGSLDKIASDAGGSVVADSREVTHPKYPDAVVRTPGLIGVDVEASDAYTTEQFGPVTFLIGTDGTEQSLATFRDTVRQHGAMTAAVYSTDEGVLDQAREAAMDAGVALSENLLGQVFVNQTAAFSDYHGTGANPAANAAYADSAFVAGRFRVITTRRHV
ncbi:phenylacetic acid degradation protein PaaN [Yimella sp. cx-51]|uniref:phenylacetic acid degradation protein PaaN n=1 Tax=Yimella sp. cx-51 TaxID=2770551 RepID=UPI00165E3604|nr:phenylacetic acid degradation protein PaaN [Yimella sp. cx-51]MBC9956626.1 phenylacetic acid degradation protein PaaN [Yimella sp. cx-51]QTH38277.1 phenylacetic acid degradation protein PaaN [Yimella sp. cx-51]